MRESHHSMASKMNKSRARAHSMPRQQPPQPQRPRRNRSRSSSYGNARMMNNNKSSRGNSPRYSNKGNTRKSSSRSRSTHTRRTTNVTSSNNNTADDDKYRFSRTLKGTIRQENNNNNAKSRSRSRTKKKFHMPHIIPNISPAALLKKHRTDDEGRHVHENYTNVDNYTENGGYKQRKQQRRGRSATPKGYHRVVGEQQDDHYASNTSRKRDGGHTNNNRGKRSYSSNAAYSRNTNSATFGLRSRRSRSASFQPNQRQQQYDGDDFQSNYHGMRTRSTSGRRKDNSGSTKPWLRTSNQAYHNNNGDEKRNRRRGKSVPARFFNTMANFGLWKGDKDKKKNDGYNSNNNRNKRSEDRKERKIRMKHDLEAPLPDNGDKRMSSRSRERGKRSSAHPAPNEWGEKPRGRSRPKHTRSRSDNYNNNNTNNIINATNVANAEQIKDLEAEMANVIKAPGPPPPPRPPPPPPIHTRPTNNNNNFYYNNRNGDNNNSNYHNPRSKSLPKNFQRYTLQDVMVEMEKEIEVPLRKKYSNDSVISPIASMDSSWRYKEQMLLRKTMADLNLELQQGRGRDAPDSTTPNIYYVPTKKKSVKRFQPPPPPMAPPPLAPPPRAAKVIDMNAIDGDDDEEEEEVGELELQVKESVSDNSSKNEAEITVLNPRRSKSVPARVAEKEAPVIPSLNEVSLNGDESNNSTSVDIEDKSSSESKQEKTTLSDSFVSNDFTFGSRFRAEPIVSVYGSSETGSPEERTNEGSTINSKSREPPSQSSSQSSSSSSSSSASGSNSAGDGDSLIGYASVTSSIAPPPHSSIRKKKPGAIALGTTPMSADRSAAHSMGTLTRMHNDLQRKMSALQEGLDEHGRPVKEFDVKSVDTSSGRVSDVTLPTVLMKAPPISSRIRAMKPKPLTTRRTKKGTLELQGDIEAMKSLAVSELTMASPVQSAYPKNMSMRIHSYKKVANNTPSSSAVPPPRRASAPVQPSRRHIQPKPETTPTPVVEKGEEEQKADSSKKNSSSRSFQTKHSSGSSKVSIGTTSRMPMKPASGAGLHHVPPPPKQRTASKIDIGEVAQQLQAVQNHVTSTGSTGSNNGNRNSSGRKYVSKGSGNSYSSVTHSHVDGMKWSDKFGKAGRYSGDVNAEYVPHGMGSMYYDFGLTVEGRWVDGTLLSHDLNDGFAV